MENETLHSLAMSLLPGVGIAQVQTLLRQCGSPSQLFRLGRSKLSSLQLPCDVQDSILQGWAVKTAEKTMEELKQRGITVLCRCDERYPHLLKEIHDPPLVLYCQGDLTLLKNPAVAVVGARRCSVYGREVTQKLARELAATGLVVVSGLARGIDAQAHVGALDAAGKTVAVLGNGVDVVYPRENRRLYERIRQEGCLLSEFPCGIFPAPQNFPIRNRIISGLCYGTLIAEASEFSGSLITARLTLEQNRELWAVPGNITNPGSYGPNYLIKQGAKIVLNAQDILDELPVYVLEYLAQRRPESAASKPLPEDDADGPGQRLLKLLPVDNAVHFDVLTQKSGINQIQLNELLLGLEMDGLVRQLPGRQFCRRLT
jgi:DNA processing protein